MRREEAFAKATAALVAEQAQLRAKYADTSFAPFGSLAPQDWAQPSIHQVIIALEAIGLVKFDADPPPCRFKVGDKVRLRVRCLGQDTARPLGSVIAVNWKERLGSWAARWLVTVQETSRPHYVELHDEDLELDEPSCPFKVGDTVRRIPTYPGYKSVLQVVTHVVFIGSPANEWRIVTDAGSFTVDELEPYPHNDQTAIFAERADGLTGLPRCFPVKIDSAIAAIRRAGYEVMAKKNFRV